tara:strand:+ start:1787 stop:2494 length:708 start_codon:yes stop_codon:yes gene_type:complete
MTFTIIGRCQRTGLLGVGIATYSLAVGSYCPRVKHGVAALSNQAFVNPPLGPIAMDLLENHMSPEDVIEDLQDHDPLLDYRQIGIVGNFGATACWSGEKCRPYVGHEIGDGFVAMGNALAGHHVVEAIAATFRDHADDDLDERLLKAIEAGRDAGGQATADGEHMAERSAALYVAQPNMAEIIDLRVDVHDTAVEELRCAFDAYRPYVAHYLWRSLDPATLPPQDVWAAQQGMST